MSTEAKKVTVADVLALAEQVDEASIDAEIAALEEQLEKLRSAKKTISLIKHGPAKRAYARKPIAIDDDEDEDEPAPKPTVATPQVTAKPANGMPPSIKDRVIECLKKLGPNTVEDIGFELNLRTVQVYGVLQAPGNKHLFKKRQDGCWELV